MIASCPVFPDDAVFNQRIDDTTRFPAHGMSTTWVGNIGSTRALHADWGQSEDQQAWTTYYGIPYNVVNGSTLTWPGVSFQVTDPRAGNGDGVPDESDCGIAQSGGGFSLERGCDRFAPSQLRFPFPDDSVIKAEAGVCNDAQQCGDRHVLVLEANSCRLWESYFSYKVTGQWYAYSTAAWNLNSNAMRPDTWTSGDAAGLPILPLLVRADEATANDIRHAFRVTFRDSVLANTYVWPARHKAGGATTNGIPFGSRLRLSNSFVIPSSWTTQAQAVARAMQRYGLIVSDIGSDLYVQGEPSAQWSSSTITQLQSLHMQNFEFVNMQSVTGDSRFDGNSYRANW
ncbi:MAG: hypothetical protein JWL63_161 [Rhodocyclales bacterium]|nr:hypothetical protein [Rhodocyclales bacterium]